MRKRILPALALCLSLLVGCADEDMIGSTSVPAVESVGALGAANVMSSAAEMLTFVLESDTQTDWRAAHDGTKLASYSYEIPVLRVAAEDGRILDSAATAAEKEALDAAAAFNDNFASWLKDTDFPGVFTWAEEDYAQRRKDGQSWQEPYDEEFTYTFWRTDRLISIAGEYYSYTGGTHPNSVLLGWNFDLQTGRFLHPTALGADSEEFQTAVTREIIRQADQRAAQAGYAPETAYWADYQSIAAQWPDYSVTFSDRGMMVTFSAYEMACYAAGPQTFEIGLDFLKSYLSEDGRLLLGIPEEPQSGSTP